MSLSILPYCALSDLNNNLSYGCNTKYNLPCQRGDSYTLQGLATQANILDLSNGSGNNFSGWNLAAGFTNNGDGSISFSTTDGGSGNSAYSAPLNLIPGQLYFVQFNVSISISSPALPAGQGLIATINGADVPLPNTTAGQGYNQSFGINWFYSPTAIANNLLIFTNNNNSVQYTVSEVVVTQMSVPTVVAYNMNDDYVQTLDPVYINYFNTPTYGDLTSGSINTTCRFDIKFSLDELPDSCYYLQIYDGVAMPQEPNFANSNGWTFGAGWTRPSGQYKAAFDNNTSTNLTTSIFVNEFETYTMGFYLTLDDNSFNNVQVKVTFSDGSHYLSPVFKTNGYQTFSFTPTAGTGLSYATLSFEPYAMYPISSSYTVSKIFISNTSGALFTGNNINLMTTCPYTHLFTATNNDAAFNFDYSQGLTHSIRLWSKMKYHNYTEDVDQYNFSDNSNLLMTASITKLYEVTIGDAAEFVHDCLSMMRLNDEFYIDGNQYVIDGAYSLKQRKATELSVATFDVKPVDGLGKNWAIDSP